MQCGSILLSSIIANWSALNNTTTHFLTWHHANVQCFIPYNVASQNANMMNANAKRWENSTSCLACWEFHYWADNNLHQHYFLQWWYLPLVSIYPHELLQERNFGSLGIASRICLFHMSMTCHLTYLLNGMSVVFLQAPKAAKQNKQDDKAKPAVNGSTPEPSGGELISLHVLLTQGSAKCSCKLFLLDTSCELFVHWPRHTIHDYFPDHIKVTRYH